jgi:hypothetical protein
MNPKNELQELCMKRKKPLPEYNSELVTSINGNISWRVACSCLGYKNTQTASSKKEAEKLAARRLFDFLTLEVPKEKPKKPASLVKKTFLSNPSENLKRVLIIDLENLPNFPSEIDTLLDFPNLDIYAVFSKHYHSPQKCPDRITKVLSPAIGANGSDTCITILTGILLADGKYDQYLFASRDKFLTNVLELVRFGTSSDENSEEGWWKPKEAHIITTKKQLEEVLGLNKKVKLKIPST